METAQQPFAVPRLHKAALHFRVLERGILRVIARLSGGFPMILNPDHFFILPKNRTIAPFSNSLVI